MDKKKLVSQSAQPVTNFIHLPSELAELSEEDLSQVRGGWPNTGDISEVPLEPGGGLCCFCVAPDPLCCFCVAPDPDIYTLSEHTVNTVAL